ncbi:hypothetical protein AVEN_159844-1 [Araneus ventricosus]|uniref:Uncharacterized protein n=1 Tax=Araneus ventricosus TaxID=182803 RepID=A0A4Y2HFR1_ARAVE|nr:hypothetical protein AVEN_159844-1 [Araneus ventricosus]
MLRRKRQTFSFHFGAPSSGFRKGARLKPLDPGEVSKSVPRTSGHKIWWVIHMTGPTVPTGSLILGYRVDHRCCPVDCAPSSTRFQNEPSLP